MNALTKTLFSAIVFVLSLWPFWTWIAAYHLLSPTGFWQKVLTIGIGVWLLGALQIAMLFIGAAAVLAINSQKRRTSIHGRAVGQ